MAKNYFLNKTVLETKTYKVCLNISIKSSQLSVFMEQTLDSSNQEYICQLSLWGQCLRNSQWWYFNAFSCPFSNQDTCKKISSHMVARNFQETTVKIVIIIVGWITSKLSHKLQITKKCAQIIAQRNMWMNWEEKIVEKDTWIGSVPQGNDRKEALLCHFPPHLLRVHGLNKSGFSNNQWNSY